MAQWGTGDKSKSVVSVKSVRAKGSRDPMNRWEERVDGNGKKVDLQKRDPYP